MISTRKIFVVDDSNDNREAVSALLRYMNYDVREAGSGDEALAMREGFKPEVFLIDVKMPGMSGLQLLEKLHNTGTDVFETIMMTGNENVEDARGAMELGAISYLRKPIRFEELTKHINEALRRVDDRSAEELQKVRLEQDAAQHSRKAEEAFKVAEFQSRRFDLVFDNMQEPLLAIDGSKRIMMVNKAAEQAFDISAGKALGRSFHEVFPESALTRGIDRVDDGFAVETDVVATDFMEYSGRHYAVSASQLIHEDGLTAGYVLIFTDKTSQYKAEQLQTMFLSVVSHEFKTPLSILMNSSAILGMKRHCSEEVEQVRNNIDDMCHRLTRLVNAMVTFARINRENVVLRIVQIDIYVMLTLLIGKFSDIAEKKELTIPVVAGGETRNAGFDCELLATAIECVLDNAIKFSPERGKVEIRYHLNVIMNKKRLHIAICDEGPGISPEKVATVFEWFTQGEDPLRRTFGGLGLGLPLANRAVALLGGEIDIRAGTCGGCTVEIVVPVQ